MGLITCQYCGALVPSASACANCRRSFTVVVSDAPRPQAAMQPVPAGPLAACPRCRSPSISAQRQGYGAGKGCCAAMIAGPLALVCGFLGASKVHVHCLNCGHRWRP